ncbi:MAG TPA: chemotaxis-specific protein-glutamate methyltransferase CheB [Pirellulaceae bacterium]|nr:chemotaxis-specific protein-glutamate methyltransferase CheB [Pirellulaceae bacterium]
MIRVLIVEDSVTQREIFRRLLADDPELTVVAEARDGREAIAQVQAHAPDVVLMDIHMPDMDGITATVEIMKLCPVPIVVASATLKKRDVDLAMKAYEAGAVSVIEKPAGAVLLHLNKIAPELRRELIAASKAQIRRRVGNGSALSTEGRESSPPSQTASRILQRKNLRIIGICASTGGPPVLQKLFSEIPKPFPIPILVVQHISRGFEEGFARWLSVSTGQTVSIATAGQMITPGVWIAPSGRHLTVGSEMRLNLPRGRDAEIHCPSGNPLFESLARHFAFKAAGIQLTGMGDDGAKGLLALKQAGGVTIIQNEASCMIWGMPKAARQSGAATHELDPDGIVKVLTQVTT